MNNKKELIDKLIKSPREFTETEMDLLFHDPNFSFMDLRPMLLRIFDINEGTIKNKSGADEGLMGKLNAFSRKKRENRFWKMIRKNNYSKIILAEGDSWFEYPVFIQDIIDHLKRSKYRYAINSLAYGGDWIANILYEQEYIEKLSLLKPDVFLISGGGNDIVGGYRLAQLVNERKDISVQSDTDLNKKEGKIAFAEACLNNEFFALIKLFKLQYKLLFESIKQNTDKFRDLKIITQGYDYVIPSSKKGIGIFKTLTNWLMKNGKWLKTPLLLRGYRDKEEQVAVVHGLIDFFNEMLINVGENYNNVYHVDSREAITKSNGWYNELHPVSRKFKKIAAAFEECIESSDPEQKIFHVAK